MDDHETVAYNILITLQCINKKKLIHANRLQFKNIKVFIFIKLVSAVGI